MNEITSRQLIPENLRIQFAVLSRIGQIRAVLTIFAVYGLVSGSLAVLVGSFTGTAALIAGTLQFLIGGWCLVLAIVIYRGGTLLYWSLLLTIGSMLAFGVVAVTAMILDSTVLAVVNACICLTLPVCLAALLASNSVRTWFLRDSQDLYRS